MTGAARPGRRMAIRFAVAFAVIVLLAAAPIISVLIASILAETHGCTLNEGNVHPCMIAGSDWGDTLYAMFVMGWFMLVTIPLGVAALAVWAIVGLVVWIIARRKANSA